MMRGFYFPLCLISVYTIGCGSNINKDQSLSQSAQVRARNSSLLDSPFKKVSSTTTWAVPQLPAQDVNEGDVGADIDRLQFALKLALNLRLDEDGQFGRKTLTALNDFQQQQGISPSSTFDTTTRNALQAVLTNIVSQMTTFPDPPAVLGVPTADVVATNLANVSVIAGEGDKVGTYNHRVGFDWGDGAESTSITQGSPAHILWFPDSGLSASDANVIGIISHNEGPFDAVNSYDDGYYTWGAYQLIGAYRDHAYLPQEDELAQGLFEQKLIDPVSFFQCFQEYGFDVTANLNTDGTLDKTSVNVTLLRPDGTTLSGIDVWKAVGTESLLNQLFINAGQNVRIQKTHVMSAKLVHFDALGLPLANNLATVQQYLTSEVLTAAFLDMELNRGRGTALNTFATALQNVLTQYSDLDITSPGNWPDSERQQVENDLLQQWVQSVSSSYATRAHAVANSVLLNHTIFSYQ